MIFKYPRISHIDLFNKIESICEEEKIIFNQKGIEELLFVSDYDIRQAINNLECIFYAFGELTNKSVYKMVDKPKPLYIEKIINDCLNGKLEDGIETTKELFLNIYT
jgi:replication factor C subunit 2/4